MPTFEGLATIRVDAARCVRCGACVRDCLARILVSPNPGDPPRTVPGGEARCFGCRHCLAICPTGALAWNGETAADCAPLAPLPTPESVESLLRRRRSVRAYRRENVPPELLARLRDATRYSPTGCNDRALFFAYSTDVATTDAFRAAAADYLLAGVATDSLPASIKRFAPLAPALESGVDVFFRTAPHFVAIACSPDAKDARIDPFIAAAQFELAANAFGLGTCWGGMATDLFAAAPELSAALNIPAPFELQIVLLFGRPAVEYARTPRPTPYPFAVVAPPKRIAPADAPNR